MGSIISPYVSAKSFIKKKVKGTSKSRKATAQKRRVGKAYKSQIPFLPPYILFPSQVFRLVNQERARAGLNALTYNASLARLARLKSLDMSNLNYLNHTSPTYGTPAQMLQRFGIGYRRLGENIAGGYPTPEAVMRGWMSSPGHRANILQPAFTDIGVGYAQGAPGSRYRHYWTQLFIQRP